MKIFKKYKKDIMAGLIILILGDIGVLAFIPQYPKELLIFANILYTMSHIYSTYLKYNKRQK